MLYYDRIDVSDFLDKGFKFQRDVCNSWHDVLMISTNLSDIAIVVSVILVELAKVKP